MDIEKFKRFSMCNCLTVRMDRYINRFIDNPIRTYTAHLMTPDLFLSDMVFSGSQLDVPFKDFWPKKEYIKTYYIPKKITTFLLSTFNEIFHPNHVFGKSPRYVIPKKFRKNLPKSASKEIQYVDKISPEEYKKSLKNLDKKVTSIWGTNINKVLVFYDYTRASLHIKKRAEIFDKIAKSILRWPTLKVKEERIKFGGSWQHYSRRTYINLYHDLVTLEKKRGKI